MNKRQKRKIYLAPPSISGNAGEQKTIRVMRLLQLLIVCYLLHKKTLLELYIQTNILGHIYPKLEVT